MVSQAMTPTATRLMTPNVTTRRAGGEKQRAADGSDVEGDDERSMAEIDGVCEMIWAQGHIDRTVQHCGKQDARNGETQCNERCHYELPPSRRLMITTASGTKMGRTTKAIKRYAQRATLSTSCGT